MVDHNRLVPFWCGFVLAAIAVSPGTTRLLAQESSSEYPPQTTGRIDFDFAGTTSATVEIDLAPELIGLGEMVASGAVDALIEAVNHNPHSSHKLELNKEQMAALQHVVSSAQGLIKEVRVRVYRLEDESVGLEMARHYSAKLQEDGWDNVATVREGDQQVKVSVFGHSDSIRGVFAIVTNEREVVMLNLACDLSPDKVKSIVSTALRIGMDFGLDQVVHEVMEELSEEVAEELR